MSADNGIYIVKLKDEYRVVMASAIENLFFEHEDGNPLEICSYLLNSRKYESEEEAYKRALQIEEEIDNEGSWTEYGICNITLPYSMKYYAEKALLQISEDIYKLQNGKHEVNYADPAYEIDRLREMNIKINRYLKSFCS